MGRFMSIAHRLGTDMGTALNRAVEKQVRWAEPSIPITDEELEKAYEEKTWLFAENLDMPRWTGLVRAASPNTGVQPGEKLCDRRAFVAKANTEGAPWWIPLRCLRVATPNDMLKYGE